MAIQDRRERVMTGGPLLVVLFLCAISLPLAANIAGVDGGDPGAENRELAAFPSLDGQLLRPGGQIQQVDERVAVAFGQGPSVRASGVGSVRLREWADQRPEQLALLGGESAACATGPGSASAAVSMMSAVMRGITTPLGRPNPGDA